MLLAGRTSHPRLHHPVSQGALCVRGWSAGELMRSNALHADELFSDANELRDGNLFESLE